LTVPPRGILAAIPTALDPRGEPDVDRCLRLARELLDQGCDGLNVLGTTGEATSLSVAQRERVMRAYAASGLPRSRLVVGTGAAAVADAVHLTSTAARLGYAAVLLLPPFYYRPLTDDGLAAYVDAVVRATTAWPIPVLLYHYPQLTGTTWSVGLIERLIEDHGRRIAGMKDSSGTVEHARAVAGVAPWLRVYPSNEATLPESRSGTFAGIISATASLNADLCARALASGDPGALDAAVRVRRIFEGHALVPGVKAVVAHRLRDPAWARVAPPLATLPEAERRELGEAYDAVRGAAVG
jgi:4-hydroxy-tetrahydrodipicolinate synthase